MKLTLYHGDCIKILPSLPSESVDLILTDPPYGISVEILTSRPMKFEKDRIYGKIFKCKARDCASVIGLWDVFPSEEKMLEYTYQWVNQCVNKLRKGGMFITWFDKDKINFISKYLRTEFGFKNKGYFAMIKSNPVPQARKVKWMNAWEIMGLWQKPDGKLTYNYELGQHPDYMINPIVSGKERTNHPTQKPLSVVKLFIKYWTNENDTVLDPFLGSGTTMLACKELNRNCIGMEINSHYIKTTKNRLNWGSTIDDSIEWNFEVIS